MNFETVYTYFLSRSENDLIVEGREINPSSNPGKFQKWKKIILPWLVIPDDPVVETPM